MTATYKPVLAPVRGQTYEIDLPVPGDVLLVRMAVASPDDPLHWRDGMVAWYATKDVQVYANHGPPDLPQDAWCRRNGRYGYERLPVAALRFSSGSGGARAVLFSGAELDPSGIVATTIRDAHG